MSDWEYPKSEQKKAERNGGLIVGKNAVNMGKKDKQGRTRYKTDSGEIVWHKQDDGAVALAKQLLDTVRNQEKDLKRKDTDHG